MSRETQTIPVDSWQAGNGTAADGVYAALANVRDGVIAHKAIFIINNDVTNLLVSATVNGAPDDNFAYRLTPGEQLKLEIQQPDEIRVAGLTAAVDYSWCAY